MSILIDTRPVPAPRSPWTFPDVQRFVAEGATVVAAHLPGRALVTLAVVADAGAVTDPIGLEGVAQITGTAILRGARGLGEEGLAVAFERVGASPSGAVGYDEATVSVAVPAGLLVEAAELLADVVRRPTLDPAEILRVRDAAIDRLAASEVDANFLAERDVRRVLHAPASRYGVDPAGTGDSLADVTTEQVHTFHAARWAQAPLTIVLAGDLTGVDLAAIATTFSVSTISVPRGSTAAIIAGGGRRISLVDVPSAVQSVLTLMAPGPARAIDDAAELNVAQAVVLATFSARLNQRLREELGYTYGARGQFQRLRDGGMLTIATQVRNDVTADAIRETLSVLERSAEDGLTDAEVEQARDNLVSAFRVQYDRPEAVAHALVERVVHDLPDDEQDRMLARLEAVTTEAALAAWRRHLDLDELVVTVAGKVDDVGEAVTGIGLPVIQPAS